MDMVIDAVNLQADAYFVKPVNPEELLRVVVEQKIRERSEEQEITEEKVSDWMAARDRKSREESQLAQQSGSKSEGGTS